MGKYLKGTKYKGTILQPKLRNGLEVFVDGNLSRNLNKEESYDLDTDRSRHGFIIMYEGCPLLHKSQLQIEIVLSSTESEYTGL